MTRNDLIDILSMSDPFSFTAIHLSFLSLIFWFYLWALQVELFKHPHLLLLQVRNTIYKLPGGRLRPGESGNANGLKTLHLIKNSIYASLVGRCLHWVLHAWVSNTQLYTILLISLLSWYDALDIDCLKRKLSSKLSAGEDGRGPEWEVFEYFCLIMLDKSLA